MQSFRRQRSNLTIVCKDSEGPGVMTRAFAFYGLAV